MLPLPALTLTALCAPTLPSVTVRLPAVPMLMAWSIASVPSEMVPALLSIAVLMLMLKRVSFTPFVVYRLFLGIVLLVLYYGFDWSFGA